jgi:hypothetical protein
MLSNLMVLSSQEGFVFLQPHWEKVNEKGGDHCKLTRHATRDPLEV